MKLINCSDWKTLCTDIYDGPDRVVPERDCVVYVPCDNIAEFFRLIENKKYKYVVVSANSDYGVCLQHEHPISLDMKKWLDFVAVDEGLGYNPLILPSRHNTGTCKITDRYSVKMHSFTGATFNVIPDNVVHWYCTNNMLEDSRVTQIPFGIPDWSEKLILEARANQKNTDTTKDIGFYINFQSNTSERANIKARYSNNNPSNPFSVIISEIPHDEYIRNVLRSVYVVSPFGNGWDCYRTLESLYCGSIPIIPDSTVGKAYLDLPVIYVNTYMCLEKIIEESGYKVFSSELDNTKADFNYWKDKIVI